MNFYRLNPRQGYASYWPDTFGNEIADTRIPSLYRKSEAKVSEYLGDPPCKPGQHGNLHKSAYAFFVRSDAMTLLSHATRGKMLSCSTELSGRENEVFHQFWITNFVDCLDAVNSTVSPSASPRPGEIGVIKRPVFDEARWDGSDLFVVPRDPSYCFFCTENFVQQWKAAKLKGAMFSRFLMDPDAIRC